MYHVIIVEDDPMVASINQQFLCTNPQFIYDGTFSNGAEALRYLENNQVDLAIVDYYMPIMDGIEFCQNVRSRGLNMSIIMITAASSSEEISGAVRLGIVDYIIKPFTYDRFQKAIGQFLQIRHMLENTQKFSQDDVDRFLRQNSAPADKANVQAGVKGINPSTLGLLTEHLKEHDNEYLSSDEIASAVNLSRITVRRYLNYLLDNKEITSQVDYSTGGRPSIKYKISVLR